MYEMGIFGIEHENRFVRQAVWRDGERIGVLLRRVDDEAVDRVCLNASFLRWYKHDHVIKLVQRGQLLDNGARSSDKRQMSVDSCPFEQLLCQQSVIFAVTIFEADRFRRGVRNSRPAPEFD